MRVQDYVLRDGMSSGSLFSFPGRDYEKEGIYKNCYILWTPGFLSFVLMVLRPINSNTFFKHLRN